MRCASISLLAAWVYPRDAQLGEMAAVALDRSRPPDLRVRIIASTGDTVTVQLVEGTTPAWDALVYLERRGVYELVRVEPWPGGRVLVALRAWPGRRD